MSHDSEQSIVETADDRSRGAKRAFDEKANNQLTQNRRTASHLLNRKIMFSLLVETGRSNCARCEEDLTEDSFSIDHMENWLDSEDPRGIFFDIKNIDFSCKICNSSHNRGKFGTRNRAPGHNEKTWTVRKPLILKEELPLSIVDEAIDKNTFLQKVKTLLSYRLNWISYMRV